MVKVKMNAALRLALKEIEALPKVAPVFIMNRKDAKKLQKYCKT